MPPDSSALKSPASLRQLQPAVLIALLSVFVLAVSQATSSTGLHDPDLWWRLRTGEWIARHFNVPRSDPFSAYGEGRAWVAHSWGFDLALYSVYSWIGLGGVAVVVCLIWTAVASTVLAFARSLRTTPLTAAVASFLMLVALQSFVSPRPWLISILCLTIELALFFWAARYDHWDRLWILPILFTVWANLHVEFILGLAALTILVSSHGRSERRLFGLLAACVLAPLLNPYGAGIYGAAIDYLWQTDLSAMITELGPPSALDPTTWVIAGMATWAASRCYRRRGASSAPLLLLAVGALLFLHARRDAWFLVVVSGIVICDRTWPGYVWSSVRPLQQLQRQHVALATAALVLLGGVRASRLAENRLKDELAREYPVQAVEYVRQMGYAGPLLNTFNWGGYLMWHLPQVPVSIDGRTSIHPVSRVQQFQQLWNGDVQEEQSIDLVLAQLIIAPVGYPLTRNLEQDQRFEAVYRDQRTLVFVRRPLSSVAADDRKSNEPIRPESEIGPSL